MSEKQCKTCKGTGRFVPNVSNMFNCELGGDCSDIEGWGKSDCLICGTSPCPDCEGGKLHKAQDERYWRYKDLIREKNKEIRNLKKKLEK